MSWAELAASPDFSWASPATSFAFLVPSPSAFWPCSGIFGAPVSVALLVASDIVLSGAPDSS